MSDLNPYEEGLAYDLGRAQARIKELEQAERQTYRDALELAKQIDALTELLATTSEQLDAARKDADEAEAYAWELEQRLGAALEPAPTDAAQAREAALDEIRAAAQLIIDRVLQEPTQEARHLRELMVNSTLTIRHPSLPRYRRWMMVNEAIRTLAAALIGEART